MMRMDIGRIAPVLGLLLFLTSCGNKYKIEGTSSVTSLDGKTLYLRTLQGGEWIDVDSTEMEHGHFKMSGEADSVRMVTLYMGDESIMPLVLEPGDIKISIAAAQLVASGTPLNDRLYAFIERRNTLESQIIELERREARQILEGADSDEVHAKMMEESEKLVKGMDAYIRQFIIDNYENVLGPGVFMMMCSTLPYPVMTKEIEDLMKTAPMSFTQNEMVRDYLDKAKENMKLIEEHQRLQESEAARAAEAAKR